MTADESASSRITDLILAHLEAGVVPWRKPWNAAVESPRPLGRRRPYEGINRLLLRLAGFACPLWVTAERAARRGWAVKPGEKSWPVLMIIPRWSGAARMTFQPALKVAEVYNLLQLSGPRWKPKAPPAAAATRALAPVEAAERLVADLIGAPEIRSSYTGAFYRPGDDIIGMPPRQLFCSAEEYYSTLFHELVHSTGHVARLDRWSERGGLVDTARERYSFEELVAEIGCQFLCSETGIQAATVGNSAAYIGSWARRLGHHRTWIVRAAPQAEAAARWLTRGRRAAA